MSETNTATVDAIIGSRINQQRTRIGLTLRELGERAGLSVSFLSDLENGKRGISAENLLSIARVLDVTPNWFFAPLLARPHAAIGPRTATRYVSECGSFCPHCEDATMAIRRCFALAKPGRDRDTQRVVAVPCYCGVCGGEWAETYRLESMAETGDTDR